MKFTQLFKRPLKPRSRRVHWWSRRAPQPAHGWGQQWVHRGAWGKNMIFSKVVPRPLGTPKQVFLAHFEPVVARFRAPKIPKCLQNGPFWDQKWVKNGSKTHFSKSGPGPFGKLEQVFLAHFEPVVTRFGPWKILECLENGPFWDQKMGQNWVENVFWKSDLRPFAMLKHVLLPHFEPVLTEFSPFRHMYAPLFALRRYLRAVWWSHLELGRGV